MAGILHLSDIHFGCENKAAVAAAARCAQDGDFQLIVISGDITIKGRLEEYEAAAAWIGALGKPILITPGNHDSPYTAVRTIAPFARFERFFGSAWSSRFDGQGLAVRAFNSARGMQVRLNWSKGKVSLRHAERVGVELGGAAEGALRLAVCHHPLMEVVGGPISGRVRGGTDAAQALTQAGVDAVLTGHIHTPFAISLPCGDGHTHAIGAATLSLRERGMPAGFNMIDWNDEAITVKAQGWNGSGFETLRTWALPRRRR